MPGLLIYLIVMFAIANFYYYVFKNPSKIFKLFILFFILISIISLVVSLNYSASVLEGFITLTGYYTLLFGIHLLLRKVFKINKYPFYIIAFFLASFLITVFFAALMQDIFNYS
ncbi:Ribonuclease BN [Chryseobacterium sp. JV274]|nr:Ribonuclease BN [Chryseobacterium sp. JV274]